MTRQSLSDRLLRDAVDQIYAIALCHWRVISSDRQWQLFKGTKSQCQRFVDSFAGRNAIAISLPSGDVVAIVNSLVIARL